MNKVNREINRTRWMDHVNEWSKNGLTQVAYCRLHGLMLVTFYTWVARVKKGQPQKPSATLFIVRCCDAKKIYAFNGAGTRHYLNDA